MALSNELISQFVKTTKDDKKASSESTVRGTTVDVNGTTWVKLDGSDLMTPISTTTTIKPGERVNVMIKDHTATITGNFTDPSASSKNVDDMHTQITEFDNVMAHSITTDELTAIDAVITNLTVKLAKFGDISAVTAKIENLSAKYADLEYISATDVIAINAEIESIKADFATITDISAEDLNALNAEIDNLTAYNADFTYVSAEKLEVVKADIRELNTKKLDAESAAILYATIDFANISEAAVRKIFSDTGVIKDLVIDGGHVTGELVGVTIKGDLIEANTLKADKLVIRGEDGLYYKLNIDALGETTTEEVPTDGLHGSVIVANTITADKVNVGDLVAFGATIGGFHIGDHSLYSGVKSSASNTTRGVFLGDDGQFAVGDQNNYLKFYKDSNGNYKLDLRASRVVLGSSGKTVEEEISNIKIGGRNLFKGTGDFNPAYWGDTNLLDYELDSNYKMSKYEGAGYCTSTLTASQGFDFSDTTKQYTISAMFKGTGEGQQIAVTLDAERLDYGRKAIPNGKWTKLVWTFYGHLSLITFRFDGATNVSSTTPIYIAQVKCEYGNKDTDWTPAPEDAQTQIDVSIKSVDVEYYLSTSSTSLSGGSWVTTAPEWVDGKYMWSRTKTTLQNGTVSYKPSANGTCIAGAKGATGGQGIQGSTGATGTGIESFTEEYYVSTSKTTQTGGSWSTTTPTWSSGKYIWTRSKIVYKNPASTVYTTPVCDSSWEAVNEIEVGGRNLIIRSTETPDTYVDTIGNVVSASNNSTSDYIAITPGQVYSFSRLDEEGDTYWRMAWYTSDKTYINRAPYDQGEMQWTAPANAYFVRVSYPQNSQPKMEKGNKITDWTPAPEDVDADINDVANRVSVAEIDINALRGYIANLVTDGSGNSLMVQTGDGWTFSTQGIQDSVNGARESLDDLYKQLGSTDTTVATLKEKVEENSEYVRIGIYEDEPCLELGEGDSEFKLIITNTRILFMEGSDAPAYISNKALNIGTAVIKNELELKNDQYSQGSFVWKVRSNGNMGLVWKGA